MATIEKRHLPAPNSPTITEGDRSRVYDVIGKELRDVLSGRQAYFSDGVQKDPQDILSDLKGFVASVQNLRENHVIDPSNVLGPLMEALKMHAKSLQEFFERSERADPIELPPEISPTTRDDRVIHVDPFPGPESPLNPLLQRNWPKELRTSIESSGDVEPVPAVTRPDMPVRLLSRANSARNNFPNQLPPSPQPVGPLGIYSGKPMPKWIVPPPIFNTR